MEEGTDSAYSNEVSTVTAALSAGEEEGVATESTDRWHLNDGSADLAERGLEIVNAGWNVSGSNLSGSSKRRRQTSKEELDVSVNNLDGGGYHWFPGQAVIVGYIQFKIGTAYAPWRPREYLTPCRRAVWLVPHSGWRWFRNAFAARLREMFPRITGRRRA